MLRHIMRAAVTEAKGRVSKGLGYLCWEGAVAHQTVHNESVVGHGGVTS